MAKWLTMKSAASPRASDPPHTGWAPGMLQDDLRALSLWLANRIDSKRHAREAVEAIRAGSPMTENKD